VTAFNQEVVGDKATGVGPTRHTPIVDTTRSPHARLRPVGVSAVRIRDDFWSARLERNRTVTLPAQHAQCETTGAFENFRRAAESRSDEPFHGRYYSDSDVYKWTEAASWTLGSARDPQLEKQIADLVALFAAAQDRDGYLNTYFSVDRVGERWTDLSVLHEMYCLGHLTQAAIAHYRVTGEPSLLDVAIRACEHVYARFTPDRVPGACGHPCLEMALVELYRTTQAPKWLRLAQWQLDSRGRGVLGGNEYLLDHAPLRQQEFVTGHAVRALYLYAAAADVVLETDDPELRSVVDRLWSDLTRHKMAVTGGVGARWDGESFGDAYELPDRSYNETCAGIALIFFAWRMLLLTGEAEFRECLENALYNAVLPGLSLSGTEFFYQNPLADSGRHRRQPWFDCACCPPNIARLLASLPGYLYTTSERGIWVQLYVGNQAEIEIPDGGVIGIELATELPWNGRVELRVTPAEPREFSLFLPVPVRAELAGVTVQGEPIDHAATVTSSGYLEIRRMWQPGDVVELSFDLPVRYVSAHPRVASLHRRVALTRGPLVYCVEQVDHDVPVEDLWVSGREDWRERFDTSLLTGVMTLSTQAHAIEPDAGPLYRAFDPRRSPTTRPATITAVPYYAWANREPGAMRVFVPLLEV